MGPGIASLRYVDGLQVLGEGVLHRHAAGAVGCKLFIGQEGRVVLSSNRVDVDSPSDNNLLLPAILPLRVPTRFDFPPGLGIVGALGLIDRPPPVSGHLDLFPRPGLAQSQAEGGLR